MKKIRILFITLAAVLFITACEKDKTGPFLLDNVAPPSITAPAANTSYVFVEADEKDTLDKFTWTVPDFGFAAAVVYNLQVDKAGADFANALTIASSNKPEIEVTIESFNMKILTIGGIAGEQADYELRVSAVINDSVEPLNSDALPVKITPYEKIIIYPMLYVPGDHNGWNQADATSVIYSVKSNNKYEGYLWFPGATEYFKLLKVPAWEEANTIGDPVGAGNSGTLQVGSWGGNNIYVTGGPGYFLIKADLVGLTYSWLKTDWGIVGPAQAGGWDNDTDMTFDPVTKLWTVTLNLTADKMKFRANNNWDLNYGDDGADKKLDQGGADISVPAAGNYTVTLDLRGPRYKYTLVKH
jgi:starch-binding outer membrane protein SusE/F